MKPTNDQAMANLALQIKQWGRELGFQQVGITDTHLPEAEAHLQRWLSNDFHGEMDYMHRHGEKRSQARFIASRNHSDYFSAHGLSAGIRR